jgi:hypothetical protein
MSSDTFRGPSASDASHDFANYGMTLPELRRYQARRRFDPTPRRPWYAAKPRRVADWED